MKYPKLELPLRTTLLYLLFGGLWILASDQVLRLFVFFTPQQATYQTFKGWFFILISGILLYLVLRKDFEKRKQAEGAQQIERAHWQGIVEGIADEVWMCDAQGKMTLLNLDVVTAMGLEIFKNRSVEEVYQEVEIFYPNGQPRPPEEAPLLRSLRGEIVRGEEIMRHRQTSVSRYRQFSSAPTRDVNGTITGSVAIVRDITDQKVAEEGLRRYELLSQHSRDIILFMRWEDGRILEANTAATQAYGYSREEMLALTIRDLRAPDTFELTAEQMAQADAGGILFETVQRRKDGSTFPVEVSSQGATISGVHTLVSIVRDITERKQAEEQLRYQATLLSNVNDAIIASDAQFRLTAWNAAAESLYGWQAEEVIGRNGLEIIRTEWPGQDPEEMRRVIAETGRWRGEATQRRKDGTRIPVEVSSIVLHDASGQITDYISVNRDITERKQAEAALRESENKFSILFGKAASPAALTRLSDHIFVDVNESWLRLFGYDREEVIGKTSLEIGVNRDVQQRASIISEIEQHNQLRNLEQILFTKSHEALTVLINANLITIGGQDYAITSLQDITEHKRAQRALRKSEQKFSIMFEKSAFAGVLSRLHNDLIVNVNEEFERVFGYTKEEVIGRTSLELGISPDTEGRARLTAELQARGSVRDQEVTLVTKSGVPRVFLLNIHLVEIGGENYVLQTAQDITERQQAEEALRQSEQRLKRAQEIAHLGSWELNFVNKQLTWSDEVYRIFGLQPQEFDATYEAFLEAVHPEDRAAVDSAYSGSIREGKDLYEIEHRVVRQSSGEIRIVHEKCEHFRDHEGQIVRSVGMVHDITERKRAEAEIANLARFPTENPNPVLRVQADGRLTYANAASQELLEDWNCGVNDDLPEQLGDFIAIALDDHLNKTVDVFCKEKVYSLMLVPIVEGGYVNIYGREITERKRAEEALKHLAEDLRRSNAELEQFAYVASHDLQEPLRMVSSYVQLLKRRYQGKLDNDADEFIGFAMDGAARMQQLINDLLAFSRVGTRGRPIGLSSCEKVLGEALTNLQVSIEESKAIITHDPLPTVFCDQPQLVQVFQNLIGNSIKFRGQQAPQIHISAKRAENEWIFSVCDNGIGLDTKFEERIFEIFQRLHSRTAYPGTGIGLAICKRIVLRHGGRIWVESRPGEGASFYFTLPVKETS